MTLDGANYPALLLNADHAPIGVWPWRRAVEALVNRDTVYAVSDYDRAVRSARTDVALPSVVALRSYEPRVGGRRIAAFTRRAVFLAYDLGLPDGPAWRCALCGEVEHRPEELSFEHVVPRSRDGETGWRNICLAHCGCNNSKGDRTLREASMTLHVELVEPTEREMTLRRIKSGFKTRPECWRGYLDAGYWDVALQQ